MFDTPFAGGYVSPRWNIMTEIEKFYEVKIINSAEDLAKIDLLMMIHPQKLPDDVVGAIKQYSELGGKTLLLLDTAAEAPRIFSPDNIEFYPSNLNGLDKFWGFRFTTNWWWPILTIQSPSTPPKTIPPIRSLPRTWCSSWRRLQA